MNDFPALLQFKSERSPDIFEITHLDNKTLLSSSEKVGLLLLNAARNYLVSGKHAKGDLPSREFYATPNTFMT